MPDQKKVISLGLNRDLLDAHTERRKASGEDCQRKSRNNLEPLAEVEGALLVVEVLHAPHPELGGLLLVGGEHFCKEDQASVSKTTQVGSLCNRLSQPRFQISDGHNCCGSCRTTVQHSCT